MTDRAPDASTPPESGAASAAPGAAAVVLGAVEPGAAAVVLGAVESGAAAVVLGAPASAGWAASWPIGRLLSTAARTMEHAWQTTLEEHGLSHAGLIVLSLLDEGESSQRELAERARVQSQTMSRTLDRLERDGLITRAEHTVDRRRHVVRRTDRGDAIFREAGRLESELFPQLADEDAFRASLVAVIAAAEPRR